MGILGIVPPYQTLQIIWFPLNGWESRAEQLTVKTAGEMQSITVSVENELILQTGSGTFQP